MKRTRLLSALLAVMMVISMMACIAVPAMAIGTLPADAVHISTITEKVTGGRNIYIETAADFITLSAAHTGKLLCKDDVVYLKNDIDINTYVGAGGTNTFGADYAAMTYGKSGVFSIDGLGYTISNWKDTQGLFAEYKFEVGTTGAVVYIKNLNLVNFDIDSTANAGLLLDKMGAGSGAGGTFTIENVHAFGGTLDTNGNYAAALIGRQQGNANVTVTIKNCSVVGCTFTDTNNAAAGDYTYGMGFVIGRADSSVAKTTIENCVVMNNTMRGLRARYKDSGGFVVGDSKHPIEFKNVAVINNTRETLDGSADYTAILSHNIAAAGTATASGIYAVGNTSVRNGTTDEPISLICANYGTGSVTDYKTDDNVFVAVDLPLVEEQNVDVPNTGVTAGYSAAAALADLNASATYADWGFDATGNVAMLETNEKAPVAVSFTKKDVTTTYYTDVNGKIAVKADLSKVDASELAALADAAWSDGANEVAKGADWANMTFTAATAYTKTSHDLSYTAGANNTHDVVCDACDAHTVTGVACTPVAVPENDVAASYFAKAKKAYKCEFCTNTWFEEDANSTFDAPYTLTFDQEGYRNNDTEVKVTLTPKADANMSGMNLDLAFSAEYLDYVEYAPSAATVVVNEVTEGNLVIAMVKADGTTLTEADAITLTFKVQGLSNSVINAALTATATLTKATVGTGDAFAVAEALTKTVAATSAASYLDFEAGDVNSDGYVDLLDAVLIIQKLNGTIGTAQDAAFKLIAADVNNSGDVNTADVTLVLQYVCEMDVTFTPAMQEPTIVVVGA